jgi:hypothetical protein
MLNNSIVHSVRVTEPVDLLKQAVGAAKEKGLRVRIGTAGVAPISTHGPERWGLDDLERDPGVDALGALLLYAQPPSVDPEEAVAMALGVDRCFVDALADGMALAPKDSRWLASPARLNYAKGYEMGCNFRIWLRSFPELAS